MSASIVAPAISIGFAAVAAGAMGLVLPAEPLVVRTPPAHYAPSQLGGAYSTSTASFMRSPQNTTSALRTGVQLAATDERSAGVMSRLAVLRSLADGWHGAGSLAPSRKVLDEIALAHGHLASTAHLSVAVDGSVVVEWEAGPHEYVLSIDRDHHMAFIVEDAAGHLIEEAEERYTPAGLARLLAAGHSA